MDNASSRYFQFTDSNFQEKVLSGKGIVVVDFFASWCPPCRALSPVIEKLAHEYMGKVLIGKYSTEDNHLYAEKFEITSIPCVKLWKDGVYQHEIMGLHNYQSYVEAIEKLLRD